MGKVKPQQHIGAMVAACGQRQIWEKVLDRAGLYPAVKVLHSERITENLVVTPQVKADLVARL